MRTEKDLRRQLAAIDRRGYPAYKGLRGAYDMGSFTLSVDRVQGDPFAAPSKLSVAVPWATSGFPRSLRDEPHRRTALEDLLVRRFSAELSKASFKVGGSGRSGFLATSRPGPEVLRRSACEVADQGATLRFEAGFPARGRTVDARALERMLVELVPRCVRAALVCDEGVLSAARSAIDLADDQLAARRELGRLGLVAFVANGSVLPRESGVSSRPMRSAKPFRSPESMRVTLDLPHRGAVAGMGVRRGVTLVVGGGYHGKSTLLRALQEGVYDHVEGDGRELVVTDGTAVKLRAEDGRSVRDADISLFVGNLPDGRDTRRFSTADASGSTSQAAAAVEAVEAGSRVLLVDEDTSATNFMVRDALMEAVVTGDCEPITPFVERVRDLWERAGVSTVVVAGSSGAFFSVADAVVQMDRYEARDVTGRVREACRALGAPPARRAPGFELPAAGRAFPIRSLASGRQAAGPAPRGRGGDARLKVRCQGLDGLSVGPATADLRLVEQLVDPEQVSALAQMVRAMAGEGLLDGSLPLVEAADRLLARVAERGWGALADRGAVACGLAMPRRQELIACLNRMRG